MLDPGAAVQYLQDNALEYVRATADGVFGFVDSFLDTVNPLNNWLSVPNIGPVFGHTTAYAVGGVAGTVGGVAAGFLIGNVASGASGLVACGSLFQKAAKVCSLVDTAAGLAGATLLVKIIRPPLCL